jgi:hypothetical protein
MAAITSPSALRDLIYAAITSGDGQTSHEFQIVDHTVNTHLLIFCASRSRIPEADVNFTLSLPARSTKYKYPDVVLPL